MKMTNGNVDIRISHLRFVIFHSPFPNPSSWCARRDSNPPPRFKKPVLRQQSFRRMALAAGFEPASTSLEERRLVPLGHASIQNISGIDEIRTRVFLIDNQAPMPLGHDPVSSFLSGDGETRTR